MCSGRDRRARAGDSSTLDLDHDGVVQQTVEQRGGDDGVAEDLAPFGEAAIRGEDHGALFVTGVDELEEQIAAAENDRQIASSPSSISSARS